MEKRNLLSVVKEEKKPWYQEGLRFSCTKCGKCCTGFSGYVWVGEKEIIEMAQFLKISVEKFYKEYLIEVDGRFSLREVGAEYSCVFLKGKQCSIYSVRPKQCKKYPWWPENLASPEAWEKEKKYCEGISSSASIVSYETIQEAREI